MSDSTPVPKVYAAMSAVQGILAQHGISKDRKNQQQGYAFRGIDDIYNFLSNSLAQEKLLIIPRTLSRQVLERETKAGGALFYVVVDMEFDFVCALDGSKHTARMTGEAMDSADKATNKAQSAAFKYVCLQTFCIPTEGMADNDADFVTQPTVAPKTAPAPAKAPASAPAPKPTPTPVPAPKPAVTAPKTPAKAIPVGDWRDAVIHFGKKAGVPLGELEENSLVWYITKWTPTDKPGYPISEKDISLRRALDVAGTSMALPGFGIPPPSDDMGEIPGL